MMTITDVTAGELVLTIDNAGNMAFGDGLPISRLSLDGYGIIDDNGIITHGINSGALTFTSGAASVDYQQSLVVTTISGRVPSGEYDTTFPSMFSVGISHGGGQNDNPLYSNVHTVINLAPGTFTIACTAVGTNGAVPDINPSVKYRWL